MIVVVAAEPLPVWLCHARLGVKLAAPFFPSNPNHKKPR